MLKKLLNLFLLGSVLLFSNKANAITVTATTTTAICNGSGSITATAAAISGSVTYSKDGITYQASNVFLNTASGTYTIYAKDATLTPTSTVVTLGSNANNYIVTETHTNVSCFGGTNGTINLSVSEPNFTIDGLFNENMWSGTLANNSGGPTPSFGAGHELNALYANSSATNLYLGVAGNVQDQNRIMIFIDCKSGGYNNGSFNRTGAPNGVNTFNGGTTFDNAFNADYVITIGTNSAHNDFFWDLFPLTSTGGGGTFLGNQSSANLEGNTSNGAWAQGFEMKIPWSSLGGLPTGPYQVFVMYSSDGGFVSNQFLTRADPGSGNYGNGALNFSAATPNPVSISPYSFSWNTGATTNNLTGLLAGTYTATVNNGIGCVTTKAVTITAPTQLVVSATKSNIACNGGSSNVTVTATGGTSPYAGTGAFVAAANSYTYIVSDANNCASNTAITVTQPSVLNITATNTSINCYGDNAVVTIGASGGTSPYTGATTYTVTAGTYTYTVADANNCTKSTIVTITQPSALSMSYIKTNIACFGGTADILINATGGANGYTGTGAFQNVAGTYTYTVTDANNCAVSSVIVITQPLSLVLNATASSILCANGISNIVITASQGTAPYTGIGTFGVNAGSYTYTVSDANNCSKSVNLSITEPLPVYLIINSTNITCNSGTSTIDITAYGGVPGYTGINTSPFTVTAGSYTYTVTDANNCTSSDVVTITQPTAVNIGVSITSPINCNGGTTTITISGTGGSGAYTGTGNYVVNANTYTYNVTDANNCTSVATITITQPTALTITASNTTINCNGGNATVTIGANGGAGTYTGTGTFTRTAGTYTFTVTDANNCTISTIVTITQPTTISIAISNTNIACAGGQSAITVSATNGTLPYAGTGIFNVNFGTYTYTVTDANNCTTSSTITVTQPLPISFAITANNNPVTIGTTLILTALPNTYTFNMAGPNSQTASNTNMYTSTASNITAGVYTFTATDGNACTLTQTISITTINATITLKAKLFLNACFDTNTGLMHDSLRIKNLIPLVQPYSNAPYNSRYTQVNNAGTETTTTAILTTTNANAIVDWVFVALRNKNNSNQILSTRAALLQRDGDVVDVDGINPLIFSNINADAYFISVYHRNHLGIMTNTAIPLSNNTAATVDFTNGSTPLYALPAPRSNVSKGGATMMVNGVHTLRAGNCYLGNGNARYLTYNNLPQSDRNALLIGSNGGVILNTYSIFDLDMNGHIKFANTINSDRIKLYNNCNNNSGLIIYEQTPN